MNVATARYVRNVTIGTAITFVIAMTLSCVFDVSVLIVFASWSAITLGVQLRDAITAYLRRRDRVADMRRKYAPLHVDGHRR